MKRTVILSSFTDEVCTKLDFEQLFLFRLDWSLVTDRSKPAKCLSPRKGTNRIFSVLLISYLAT